MGSVKILAITDQVVEALHSPNIVRRYGDVDLIISCGDLPYDYLDYIVTMLNKPMYFVHGNHDRDFEYTETGRRYLAPRGAEALDMQSIRTPDGLILAGLEGSIRYDLRSGHQYTQEQMARRAWQSVVEVNPQSGAVWALSRHPGDAFAAVRHQRWPRRGAHRVSRVQYVDAPFQAAPAAARAQARLYRRAAVNAGGRDAGGERVPASTD